MGRVGLLAAVLLVIGVGTSLAIWAYVDARDKSAVSALFKDRSRVLDDMCRQLRSGSTNHESNVDALHDAVASLQSLDTHDCPVGIRIACIKNVEAYARAAATVDRLPGPQAQSFLNALFPHLPNAIRDRPTLNNENRSLIEEIRVTGQTFLASACSYGVFAAVPFDDKTVLRLSGSPKVEVTDGDGGRPEYESEWGEPLDDLWLAPGKYDFTLTADVIDGGAVDIEFLHTTDRVLASSQIVATKVKHAMISKTLTVDAFNNDEFYPHYRFYVRRVSVEPCSLKISLRAVRKPDS